MRSISALVSLAITFFLLTACSQTSSPLTRTPTVANTNTPLPTQTSVPSPTFTATPTVVKFDADTWGQMSETQKLAAVPKSDEYTVGIISTLDGKGNYVSVNDPKTGEMTGAWNSKTGQIESIEKAGFVVLSLNDGTKWDIPAFIPTMQEATTSEAIMDAEIALLDNMFKFIVEKGVAWGVYGPFKTSDTSIDYHNYEKIGQTPNLEKIGSWQVDKPNLDKFYIQLRGVMWNGNAATLVIYVSDEKSIEVIFLGMSKDKYKSLFKDVHIPTRTEQ